MQRISVDFPEPDGPHITIRSRFVQRKIDVLEYVEVVAEPLVHFDNLNNRRACDFVPSLLVVHTFSHPRKCCSDRPDVQVLSSVSRRRLKFDMKKQPQE